MAQRVRSPASGYNAKVVQAPADHPAYSLPAKRPDRGDEREEESTFGTGRTDLENVSKNGLPDASGKGVEMRPARLGTTDAQQLVFPIQILQPQAANFSDP